MKQTTGVLAIISAATLAFPAVAASPSNPTTSQISKPFDMPSLVELLDARRASSQAAYVEFTEYRFQTSRLEYEDLASVFRSTHGHPHESSLADEIDALVRSPLASAIGAKRKTIAARGDVWLERSERIEELDSTRENLEGIAKERGSVALPLPNVTYTWTDGDSKCSVNDDGAVLVFDAYPATPWYYDLDRTLHDWSPILDRAHVDPQQEITLSNDSGVASLQFRSIVEDFGELTTEYLFDLSRGGALLSIETHIDGALYKSTIYAHQRAPGTAGVYRPVAVIEATSTQFGPMNTIVRRIDLWNETVESEQLQMPVSADTMVIDTYYGPFELGCRPDHIDDPPVPFIRPQR